ncbi:MAG: single-stranded-DNA-specific exonuclease RecJ [Maricaulaceae bacterium]
MDASGAGALEGTRSASGRVWRERPRGPAYTPQETARHARGDADLARFLAQRGVAPGQAEDILDPKLSRLFPDPARFVDMDRASSLILDAVDAGRRIAVFADYDVDGASSSALLRRWLRAIGKETLLYVPDRVREGFGPSVAAFRALKAAGAELVITVDCGGAATEAIAEAGRLGLTVVVVDHHLMPQDAPAAAALVNPNRPDCRSGCGALAAAGVAYVLLAALNREAVVRGWFSQDQRPDLLQWADLAALGTLADMCPLVGPNRAMVTQGLKLLTRRVNPGVAALAERARAGAVIDAQTVSFALAPRLNAAGRVGRADLAAALLACDDPGEAARIAETLDEFNQERRAAEAEVTAQALALAQVQADDDAAVIVVEGEGWHPGVVGLAAGRIKERFNRPAVAIGWSDRTGRRVGSGSGRSIPGVDLGAAASAAARDGLIVKGGGHAQACGLTLAPGQTGPLTERLRERLTGAVTAAAAQAETLWLDGVAPLSAVSGAWAWVSQAAPFGPGFPEPVFAAQDLYIRSAAPFGAGHMRLEVSDQGTRAKITAFRTADGPLSGLLTEGRSVHLAVKLARGWRGEAADLILEDAAATDAAAH